MNQSDLYLLDWTQRHQFQGRRPGARNGAAEPAATWGGPAVSQEIRPWWLDFPRDARYFDKNGTIATPALGSSLTSVLSFTCPPGWDGVLVAISQNYTGAGLVAGSGDLTWTIRRAGAVEVEYNAVPFELGTSQEPTETIILVHENELVEYLVSVAAGAGIPIAGTFIVCRMKGWFVPRGL